MRAVKFPQPILTKLTPKFAETFPNWPNYVKIGAQKNSNGSNFIQIVPNSIKIEGGNETARISPFFFGHSDGKQNTCVRSKSVKKVWLRLSKPWVVSRGMSLKSKYQ
jgi:hypothetical protein